MKEFCPLDELEIFRTEEGVNICQFAGRDIDISIDIADATRETFLSFPEPNFVTPPVEVIVETVCSSSPTEIWFQLSQRSCAASENSQGMGRRRKRSLEEKLTRQLKSKDNSKGASKKASSFKSSSISFSALSNSRDDEKPRSYSSKGGENTRSYSSKGGQNTRSYSSKGGQNTRSYSSKGVVISSLSGVSVAKGGKGSIGKGGKGSAAKGGKGTVAEGGKGSVAKGGQGTVNNIYVSEITEGECKDHCSDIEFPAFIQIYSIDKSKMFFDGEVTENKIFKIGPCEIPNALTVAIYKM